MQANKGHTKCGETVPLIEKNCDNINQIMMHCAQLTKMSGVSWNTTAVLFDARNKANDTKTDATWTYDWITNDT